MNSIIKFEDVSFKYPNSDKNAMEGISFSVDEGEFVVVCGQSGCGKSTLLSHMKKNQIPFGKGSGDIYVLGKKIEELTDLENAEKIGFIGQDIDSETVTDKVWHELAFGLENLHMENDVIYRRIAEISEYFGLSDLFRKNVNELSGGERQILTLASVMCMHPSVLILDEPTNQLDPLSASNLIKILEQLNQEFSTTIIISEQRPEAVIPLADKVLLMHEGRVVAFDEPKKLGNAINEFKNKNEKLPVLNSFPAAMRLALLADMDEKRGTFKGETENALPLSVREGRAWIKSNKDDLGEFFGKIEEYNTARFDRERGEPGEVRHDDMGLQGAKNLRNSQGLQGKGESQSEYAVSVKELAFSYGEKDKKSLKWGVRKKSEKKYILENLDLKVSKGSFISILGSNGSGKTTLLKLIGGILEADKGSVNLSGRVSYLTQNPLLLFTEITVEEELAEIYTNYTESDKDKKISDKEIVENVNHMLEKMRLTSLRKSHPYDLSGGERQRLALGKVLLTEPEILLLDEPTKGLDAAFKSELAKLLKEINEGGTTIIMVSHDMEFVAKNSMECALLFDGRTVETTHVKEFFLDNHFFTTATRRLTDGLLSGCVVLPEM